MKHPGIARLVLAVALGAGLVFLNLAHGQQIHRNGFEGRSPAWQKGAADVPFRETEHAMTDLTAHTGQNSEHVALVAEKGNYIHYLYATGRVPVSDELSVSVWIKSNRPGTQLMARLVLPREQDPANLDARLTTLLRGEQYQSVGRWQRLELRRPEKLAKEQQQLMRAELKRDVNFTEAYVDQLILNVYGGPGQTEVWMDDLEIGPVLDAAPPPPAIDANGRTVPGNSTSLPRPGSSSSARAAVVEMNQDRLLVAGMRFFLRAIRLSDTPLKTLRQAGLNVLFVDSDTPVARLEEAVNLGFWLVPTLREAGKDSRLSSSGSITQEVMRFPMPDAVLMWYLGGGLVEEQKDVVTRDARAVHSVDAQKPVTGDVWDGFKNYSRNLDLIGVHRWPLMTGMELDQYCNWLNQRRLLARPGTFTWTWVQTHLPEWYTNLVYGRSSAAGFDEPIGPQPEQIRLLSYIALAAGYKGIGFWSDRFLADTHQGRDRLLAMALINLELQMLEPLLVTADEPRWIDTSQPEVKAAVFRGERGVLVLPVWLGRGAQFVPGQSAATVINMVVPEVPSSAQAWEVRPAEVRSLRTTRVAGGVFVSVPEFDLTSAVVFTSDNSGMLDRLQNQSRMMRKMAAQWGHDLAQVELDKVTRVHEELEQLGQTLPDGQALLENSRKRLKASVEFWENGDYQQSYAESERAMRPLRIFMRAHWEKATKELDSAVASPCAVSFYTLPQHWRFMESFKPSSTAAGANVLPAGDFENSPDRPVESWVPQETTLDEVEMVARRVSDKKREGQQSLMLRIAPRSAQQADGKQSPPPVALERTFLSINSPAVRLPPGTPVRISGWMHVPAPITASADGALFYDTAGGEPLAIRVTNSLPWKKFTLYRKVPASGSIGVTLALTGLGQVYFDDIRIEPVAPTNTVARPAFSTERPVLPTARP